MAFFQRAIQKNLLTKVMGAVRTRKHEDEVARACFYDRFMKNDKVQRAVLIDPCLK